MTEEQEQCSHEGRWLMMCIKCGHPTKANDARYEASVAVEARIAHALNHQGVAKKLAEALRSYMLMDQAGGEEKLWAEFDAPEFRDSSISTEAWLERVLRGPAREALALYDSKEQP